MLTLQQFFKKYQAFKILTSTASCFSGEIYHNKNCIIADISLARTAHIFIAQNVSFSAFAKTSLAEKLTFCTSKMLAVLANKMSNIIQFRLAHLLC